MSGPLLGTFSIEGLKPLGSPAQRSFELVYSAVCNMLDEQHASIFAEPVATRHGNQIDWYANQDGIAIRLKDLTESDHDAAVAALDARLAAVRELASKLLHKKSPEEQRLAEAIQNACTYPDSQAVFVVRGHDGALHPVITNWAWTRDEQRMVRGVLAGKSVLPKADLKTTPNLIPDIPTAHPGEPAALHITGQSAASGKVETSHNGPIFWLILFGWLVFTAMVAVILWLLIAPCGLHPEAFGNYCPGDQVVADGASDELAELRVKEASVAAELALLEQQLLHEQSRCTVNSENYRSALYRNEIEARREAEVQGSDTTVPVILEDSANGTPAREASAEDANELEERVVENDAIQGKLAFSLAWNSRDDLDLMVKCPTGEIVSFRNRSKGACGGRLDIDANTGGNISERPIENIYFETVRPGRYEVTVRMHYSRSRQPQDFTLRANVADSGTRIVTGRVSPKQPNWTWAVEIGK